MNRRRLALRCLAFAMTAALSGCGRDVVDKVRLASTTSFRDTGFADVLLPAFTAETGIEVEMVTLGTGEALKVAERGDADAVLVHARQAEDEFMAKGFGVERRDVWWNRFVVAGPADDPAGVRRASGAKDALARIGAANAPFVSRGDDSGTHKKEMALWGTSPHGTGYQETGQGQGPTLVIASEKKAYALTDEGTFLRMRAKLALEPLVEGDPLLRNPYGALVVRKGARGADRFDAAKRLVAWLTGPKAQALVRSFLVDGKRAFYLPDEVPPAR